MSETSRPSVCCGSWWIGAPKSVVLPFLCSMCIWYFLLFPIFLRISAFCMLCFYTAVCKKKEVGWSRRLKWPFVVHFLYWPRDVCRLCALLEWAGWLCSAHCTRFCTALHCKHFILKCLLLWNILCEIFIKAYSMTGAALAVWWVQNSCQREQSVDLKPCSAFLSNVPEGTYYTIAVCKCVSIFFSLPIFFLPCNNFFNLFWDLKCLQKVVTQHTQYLHYGVAKYLSQNYCSVLIR